LDDDDDSVMRPPQAKRQKKKWSDGETQALIDGVRKHGEGNWATIRDEYWHVFSENDRRGADLKDKWRVIKKQALKAEAAAGEGAGGEPPSLQQ
jgi:hypothetical protein